MAFASGVAATAMAFLAIDAAVDVSPSNIAKRFEVVQASLTHVAVGHRHLAFAVRAWARGSDQTADAPACELCIQRHEQRPQPVGIDRGV